MNLLARIKTAVCRYHTLIEFCRSCGRRVDQVWYADDRLWRDVVGPNSIRCVRCFDREARRRGILLRWTPVVDWENGEWRHER